MRISKISTHVMLAGLVSTILVAGSIIAVHASAATLKDEIDEYFSSTKSAFEDVAGASAVKGTRLSVTDRHFVAALKRHQVLYTLIRTNSKGVIISEVIRGERPERNYRNIANQQWFSYVKENLEDYHGLVKEDDAGRYYLFWSKPVLKNQNRFVGAVVAKVDIWDSFHKFSDRTDEPFLIRLGNKSLYSHKWKGDGAYEEEALSIPGIDKISVRVATESKSHDSVVAVTAPPPPAELAPAVPTKTNMTSAAKLKSIGSSRGAIIIAIIALLIIAIFVIRLFVQIKHWRLMRKVDKDDIF